MPIDHLSRGKRPSRARGNKRDQFQDAFERYLPPNEVRSPITTSFWADVPLQESHRTVKSRG